MCRQAHLIKGKAMQAETILEELMDYLERHVRKAQGLPWQEPYKGQLFEIFQAAYRAGLTSQPPLTGDSIRGLCEGRWQLGDDKPSQALRRTLEDIAVMWNAWRYALDRSQP
jgi:hypothetical protein